jgi:hypothetical protein
VKLRVLHPIVALAWPCSLLLSFLLASPIPAQENLAFQKPAISSGANWGAFKPAALTDGDPFTFTHPLGSSGTLGFYYQVDLGGFFRLDRIVLHNRRDGCCPERLSKLRLEVYGDGGDVPAALHWSADLA